MTYEPTMIIKHLFQLYIFYKNSEKTKWSGKVYVHQNTGHTHIS
jgi:hypothetical protein